MEVLTGDTLAEALLFCSQQENVSVCVVLDNMRNTKELVETLWREIELGNLPGWVMQRGFDVASFSNTCSSASARQETLLTTEEKTEVDALETAIKATDANQTIEEPEEVVRHTEGVDGFSDDIDYLSIMKQSCLNGDYEAGVVAEKARNKKIDGLGLNVTKVFFEDLLELSKIITAECGDKRLPFEWKLAVGEVVINRADSPEFPDTIKEVIHAEGQYANANTDYFKNLTPFEPCVEAAARLLSGERVLNEPSVVFQSGGVQGSGVYLELYSSYYGYTYLCYSSYPELYGG